MTVTPNQLYQVEVLSNPIGYTNNRSLGVNVNGVSYATDIQVPAGPTSTGGNANSMVYEFTASSTTSTLDLSFIPGATNDNNPFVTAIALTAVPEPSSLILCGLGAVGLLVAARRRRKA